MSDEFLTRFGVITDAHYSHAEPAIGRSYVDSPEKLAEAVKDLDAEVDILVNLGDLIDSEVDRETEAESVRHMGSILDRFRGTTLHLLGNHDLQCFTKQDFLALLPGDQARTYYFTDLGDVRFIALDGNHNPDFSDYAEGNFRWDAAWLGPQQLTWLEGALATERPVIVLCHQNLDPREDPAHVVGDAAQARAILEKAGNVKVVIQGHDHAGHIQFVRSIPYVTLQAMVMGAGLENNAYAVIDVMKSGRINVNGRKVQKTWYSN